MRDEACCVAAVKRSLGRGRLFSMRPEGAGKSIHSLCNRIDTTHARIALRWRSWYRFQGLQCGRFGAAEVVGRAILGDKAVKIPGRAVAMAAALAVCATSAAQAATLMVNEGSVLVNRGDGFKSVTGSVEVAAGDTIMVKAGGRGLVTFPDQCNVRVDAGATYTVGARSPCALADAQTGTQPTGAPVGLPPVAGAGLGTTGLLVGGAVVAVGAGVAIAASKSSRPASP